MNKKALKSRKMNMNKAIANAKVIRQAEVKALLDIGLNKNNISDLLGMHPDTIEKYALLTDPQVEILREVMFKRLIGQKWQLSQKAYQKIDQTLSDDEKMKKTKLWELTNLYNTTSEGIIPKKAQQSGNLNIQVNIAKDNVSVK